MFNLDDLHPKTGKYKHIIIPPGVESVKVKMKKAKKPEVKTKPAAVSPASSPYPRYRNDAINQ